MARVKRAVNAQKKRRVVLEQASGYRGQRSRLYRKAKEQVTHSLVYAYREPDRIVVASTSGFLGLGLNTLLGIGEGGSLLWPELQGNKATRLPGHYREPGGNVR